MSRLTKNQKALVEMVLKYTGLNIEKNQLPRKITKQYLSDYEKMAQQGLIRGRLLVERFNGYLSRYKKTFFGYYFGKWWVDFKHTHTHEELVKILDMAAENGLVLYEEEYYVSDQEQAREFADELAFEIESIIGGLDFGGVGNHD